MKYWNVFVFLRSTNCRFNWLCSKASVSKIFVQSKRAVLQCNWILMSISIFSPTEKRSQLIMKRWMCTVSHIQQNCHSTFPQRRKKTSKSPLTILISKLFSHWRQRHPLACTKNVFAHREIMKLVRSDGLVFKWLSSHSNTWTTNSRNFDKTSRNRFVSNKQTVVVDQNVSEITIGWYNAAFGG